MANRCSVENEDCQYCVCLWLIGVGIFSHLTIRSDSDSGSHDPIPERFMIYFFPPLLIN